MKTNLRWVLIMGAVAALAVASTGCTAKLKKAYHESRADKYYAAGEYDRAEIEYRNVLRSDNHDAKAFSRLGFIFFDQGRFQTAAPFLAYAATLATNDLEVHMKLGQVYMASGLAQQAGNEASFILDRNPQSDEAALLLVQSVRTTQDVAVVKARLQSLVKAGDRAGYEVALGTLAYRDGDSQAADADFKKALALDPKSPDALESMAALQIAQGDVKSAEANFKLASDLSPARSTKRMLYARFKLQSGDKEAATQILQDVVKQAADYIPALMGLGEIALQDKKYDECQDYVTKILARDPDNFDGMSLSSRLCYARGDLPNGQAALERMSKLYPQAPQVHYLLGVAYLASGDDTRAMSSLNQSLQLDPSFTDAAVMLAEVQVRNQNPDPAIVSLGKVVQKYPKAVRPQMLLAQAYRERGRNSDALAIYDNLEKIAPKEVEVPLQAGSIYLQMGDKAQAKQSYEHAQAIAPNNLAALENLVGLDLDGKNFDSAKQRVEVKMGQFPTNLTLRLLLAKVQMTAGDRAGAEKTLQDSMSIDPQNDQPHLLLAQLYFDEQQGDKAMTELQAATSRNPKNIAAIMLLAGQNELAKDYKGAAENYEKVLAIDPKFSAALNNLAYVYGEYLGRLDRAYDLAQQARQLLPTDPSTADTLGWICLKRGMYPTALALLQEAAAKLPAIPDVQFHLGMAQYMMSNEAGARAAWQLALAGGKDFHGRDECQICVSLLDINPQTADDAARQKLEQRVSARPEDPVAQGRLGAIYQRDGKTDKAIGCFEAVLKTDPKNLAAMNALARLYATTDKDKAYTMARSAYKLAPNDPDTAHMFGWLAFENGDYKLAANTLQPVVQAMGGDPVVQFDYARAAYSIGKVVAAKAALQAAMAANLAAPRATEAKRMADLIAAADNPQSASAGSVGDILKAEPDYVPALMVQAKLKEMANDASGAADACEKIIAKYPDFAPAERELAILYSRDSSKAKVANSYALKAREEYPTDAPLLKATAIIAYQQGEFSRAAGLLKNGLTAFSNDAEVYYYLGAAQYKLKDRVGSKANLQQAVALNLTGPLADSAKQMLTDLK